MGSRADRTIAEAQAPAAALTVYLCDDAPAVRERLYSALEAEDDMAIVGEAPDPVEALGHLAHLRPDAIVLDLSMPRMDGLEAIAHLARKAPDTAIVVYSGFLGDVMGPRALELGADRYIGKDEDLDRLARAIRDAVADRRAGVRPVIRGGAPTGPTEGLEPTGPGQSSPGSVTSAGTPTDILLDGIPRGTAIAAITAMFALAAVFAVLIDGTQWVGLICCVPLMLGGIRFGLRGFFITWPLATAMMLAEHFTDGPASEVAWLVAAGVAFAGMAAIPGWFSDRARRELRDRAEANRELARSNAELARFAYVASHDLGEPLRTIHGFAELLERRYSGRLDDKADRYIEHIVGGTSRMQRLIDDLLDYSRLGRAELNIERVDLGELVDGAIAALGASLGSGGAVTHDRLPAVDTDARLLAQVMQNLIGNGLKFARPDVAAEVRVSAERVEGEWVVHVRDNGIGIEPEYAERIFQMFQRLHSQHEISGTGIGLSICERTIERLGGRIWVRSTPGAGSTFSFSLPDRP